MGPTAIDSLLRGFAWARLGLAVLLLALAPSALVPPGNVAVFSVAALLAALSSGIPLLTGPPGDARRLAWLMTLLDAGLITAIVAATGGARSIFAFLYVLLVTGACVLLSRTGGLAIAAVSSVLYTGVVFASTVLPTIILSDTPDETTGLEILTMFLNAGTFLIVAILAGGLAERFRATRQELESQRRDLRDVEAFRDLVFHSVGSGLIALDRQHRITAFNRAAEDITGVAAQRAIGAPWGALFGADVSLDPIEIALERDPRASVQRETALRRPDGSVLSLRLAFSALRAGDGARVGLIAVCDDLSAQRDMEARMRQADRLATLGRMAANIAHEIRNPLASLTGAIEVLTSLGTTDDARERLSAIVLRESGRLNEIIKNFLEYARPAPLSVESSDVAEIAEEVLLLLEHRTLPDSLKVVKELTPPLRWRVDAQRLKQALWNLCLNALEAMPAGGELRIGAAVRGRTLEIWVGDTGEGIPATELGQIFEPFFSTKPDGSGLGLAVVHRIVQEHGGAVDVRSAPGAGSTFTISLPARDV